jgi:hypothetical protein
MILNVLIAVRQGQGPQRGQTDQQGCKGRRGGKRKSKIILHLSVNNTTVQLAPDRPVKELGNVLPQILDFLSTVLAEEHIHFAKIDLADGYWRMITDANE